MGDQQPPDFQNFLFAHDAPEEAEQTNLQNVEFGGRGDDDGGHGGG